VAAAKKPGNETKVNPLLSRLLSHGVDTSVLRGYIGPSKKDGTIRLYPTLGFLHLYYEIDEDDIVDTAPAPTAALPHDGTIVWVRSDAEVAVHGDTVITVPVRTLKARPRQANADTADRGGSDSAKYVDVVRGRLRMSLPVMRADDDVCASCDPCSSCSGVCQSGPATTKAQ
jgi:hypothetical protein